MTELAISAENLTRTLGKITAVDNLDLEIPSGIVFGFLGPNGAGKTTTIRLLLGLLSPTEGSATVLGLDTGTQSPKIRAQCGALLEHSGLYERLTAEDNLDFYGRVWRLGRRYRKARIKDLLTHLNLWDRRDELIRTWSRGMKQKLAVARTLLHKPPIVFLDEPTAGLDPVASSALREDLAGLVKREGATVFLTTHNLQEAEKLCSKIGVINKGKLLAIGHPDSVRSENSSSKIEVVGAGFSEEISNKIQEQEEVKSCHIENGRFIIHLNTPSSAAPLVKILVELGVRIEEVRKGKASLEEAFLTLMKEEESEE